MSILDTLNDWQAENPTTALITGALVGGVVFGTGAYYAMKASTGRRIKKANELAAATKASPVPADPKVTEAANAKAAAENAVDDIVRQAQPKAA